MRRVGDGEQDDRVTMQLCLVHPVFMCACSRRMSSTVPRESEPPKPDVDVLPEITIRDVEVVSETLKLECGYCHDILVDGVACNDGHSFCRFCIETWLDCNGTCPSDRSPLAKEDLRAIPLMVQSFSDELKVKCFFNKPLLDGDVELCPFVGAFGEITSHMKACPWRLIRCGDCLTDFRANALAQHKESCALVPLRCEHCEEYWLKSHMKSHLENRCSVCPSALQSCICGQSGIRRKDLPLHMSSDVGGHMVKFVEQVVELERGLEMLDDLRWEIDSLKRDMEQLSAHHALDLLRVKKELGGDPSFFFNFSFKQPLVAERQSPEFGFAGLKFFFQLSRRDDGTTGLYLGTSRADQHSLLVLLSCSVNDVLIVDSKWYRGNGATNFKGSPNFGLPLPAEGIYRFCAKLTFIEDKKYTSGYMLFSQSRRAELAKEESHLSFGELTKQLANEWNNLSQDERESFMAEADSPYM